MYIYNFYFANVSLPAVVVISFSFECCNLLLQAHTSSSLFIHSDVELLLDLLPVFQSV